MRTHRYRVSILLYAHGWDQDLVLHLSKAAIQTMYYLHSFDLYLSKQLGHVPKKIRKLQGIEYFTMYFNVSVL